MQFESNEGAVENTTLYKLVRKLEGEGHTGIKVSHLEVKRPASREPGQRDSLQVKVSKAHDFKVKNTAGDRDSESHKTVFGVGLKKKPSRLRLCSWPCASVLKALGKI